MENLREFVEIVFPESEHPMKDTVEMVGWFMLVTWVNAFLIVMSALVLLQMLNWMTLW